MSKIVVIDDSKFMRNLLSRFLESAGHEVVAWGDVSAAELGDRVLEQDPDLLITDFQMPLYNGVVVTRLVRKAKPGLPVVVLTASHDPLVMKALLLEQVSRILHKPLHSEELLDAVRDVL